MNHTSCPTAGVALGPWASNSRQKLVSYQKEINSRKKGLSQVCPHAKTRTMG